MKKAFTLENLDCANCAAKMQRGISKIEGVSYVSVNFLSGRLVLEADDSRFEQILDRAAEICRSIEPDCKVVR